MEIMCSIMFDFGCVSGGFIDLLVTDPVYFSPVISYTLQHKTAVIPFPFPSPARARLCPLCCHLKLAMV